jgi:chromosome segregation ATPase
MARSWIDQPAHARQAELTDHRPGTLPANELRALFDERADLSGMIRRIDWELPRHNHMLEEQQTNLDRATRRLDNARVWRDEVQQHLQAMDRPIARRWHRDEIRTAAADLERSSGAIIEAEADYANAASLLDDVRKRIDMTTRRTVDRPHLEYRLTRTSETLNADAAVRGVRLAEAAPAAITAAIGRRPSDPRAAKAWEQAGGRLEQFHLSFGEVRGLGPSNYFDQANLADSRQRAEQAMTTLSRELDKLNPTPQLTRDHGLGISH